MRDETIPLAPAGPGQALHLRVLRYGEPGRGPKAVIQAALHADEVPALLVAQKLRVLLAAEEASGRLAGEVLLVPFANPIGLAQSLLGHHVGRFDLRDGVNFNRNVPELGPPVAAALLGRLGADEAANTRLARQALADAAAALHAPEPAASLKIRLLQLAADADIVLDLHCDGEAALHLYALTPQADIATELGALMGARAILLATESGDWPFDEACSKPWLHLQQQFPGHPLPLGCFSTTVELRGQADTGHATAQRDAEAIVAFLRRRGVLAGPPPPLPEALCAPTLLAASEPVATPTAGVVVFLREPGDTVAAGEAVAEVVCPDSGAVTPLHAQSAGVLYARIATRWARAGDRLCKIAGTALQRTGKLLSA
jgi:predicted deacylase